MHDVAVGDDIFLAFQPQLAGIAGARFAAERDVIGIGDGFGADKPFFKVGVNDAGGLGRPATLEAVLLTVQVMLEGSVREASRFGITGYTPAGTTRDAQIRATIAQYSVGMVNMNNVVIVTRVFQSFGQIVRPEPCYKWLASGTCDTSSPQNYSDSNGNGHWDDGNGTNGSGGSGDIVLYTVHYRHQMMTGLMRRIMGINGWVALEASVLVRNEPW
jgi:hypothetical protein